MVSRFSCVQLSVTLWTVACQASLSTGFPRQEDWSGLPFPSAGDLPDPGVEPTSLMSSALAGGCSAGDPSLIPGLGRPPWRRERLPSPVFWSGEFHGLHSPRGRKESDTSLFTARTTWEAPIGIGMNKFHSLSCFTHHAKRKLNVKEKF